LTPAQIAKYAKEYGIKTIINLRGDNTGSSWYDAEVGEASRLGITHIDFGMSARRELTASQADALIVLMKGAQKPILIHCKDGADRSGLASALYLAAVKKSDEAMAKGQLSIGFGHFSLPFIPEYAMDRTFESLEPSLGFSHP
jgi:protein tyrosine/serine phosphatase